MTQRRFDEIKEENNENQIAENLRNNEAVTRKHIESGYSFVGKDATYKYYNEYKALDKQLMKKDLKMRTVEDDEDAPQESASISLLEKAQGLGILPLCLGLVKTKGLVNTLNVNNYNLGDKYVIALAAGLKNAKVVERCHLSANRITDIGMSELSRSLNHELSLLDLSHNKITKIEDKLLQLISEGESHLEYLNLGHNLIREADAMEVMVSATLSRRLKSLNLSHNRLGTSCGETLCDLLKDSTLEHLYIGQNYFSSKVGEEVFKVLITNKHLRVLDYSLNQLG